METLRSFNIALLLVSACYVMGGLADTVTPEIPAAYEPFVIDVWAQRWRPGDQIEYVLNYDSSDNSIFIGYLNHDSLPYMLSPLRIQIEIQGLPPGTYNVKTAYMPALDSEDYAVNETELTFTVAAAPATQRVYAFFNDGIKHYFVTASDDEAEGLLNQNQGWQLVDFGFNAWHADDPAPAAAVPVCRFYSSLVNSHFYTGDAEECARLQEEDFDWQYEGIAFQALIPMDGACPAGTDPVWRLYNNRFAQGDSNHRFVASSETYRTMIADGWLGEGAAFCSPPDSEG